MNASDLRKNYIYPIYPRFSMKTKRGYSQELIMGKWEALTGHVSI